MQTHKPPTLFRLFLLLLDLQTALPLLRTETAEPPTVANTFGGDESDEGNDDDDDDSASEIELGAFPMPPDYVVCYAVRQTSDPMSFCRVYLGGPTTE